LAILEANRDVTMRYLQGFDEVRSLTFAR